MTTKTDAALLKMIANAEAKFDGHRAAVLEAEERGLYPLPTPAEVRRGRRLARAQERAVSGRYYHQIQHGWVCDGWVKR